MTIRLLLCSKKGAGSHYGGPGTSLYRLYRLATEDRLRITLLHGYRSQEQAGVFAEQHYIADFRPDPISQYRFTRATRHWIGLHAKRHDVLLTADAYHSMVTAAAYAQKCNLPAVVRVTNYRSNFADRGGWKRWLGLPRRRRETIKRLDAVIALSRNIVAELREYGVPDDKIAYIPNGVDTLRFSPADDQVREQLREQLGWPQAPLIVFVGSICRRKRPHLLVSALQAAVRQGIDCVLVFAGPEVDPGYSAQIRSLAIESRVSERIIWIGFTTDVASILRAADVFALPSSNEGMPNAMLEAMASGLPTVATAFDGVSDLIDTSCGRIAEDSVKSIAGNLINYLSDRQLRLQHGLAAHEKVKQCFSAEAVLGAHEQLFRKLISGVERI